MIALLVVFIALCLAYFYNRSLATPFKSAVFVFLSDVFLFLSAVYSCYYVNPKNASNFYGYYVSKDPQEWVGEIAELPIEKEKFYKVVLQVKSVRSVDVVSTNGKALVYFKKPVNKANLLPGNNLIINSTFISVNEPLNPDEFNYKEFLASKGIYYQSFVEPENQHLQSSKGGFFPLVAGQNIKVKIIEVFNRGLLTDEAAKLCTALLTGYDDEIDTETVNAFAHSGTLHVLSVSGLHTGILFAVVVFLLGLIDRHKKYKRIQLFVLLVSLWGFVLITGFSPPVLRAAVMLSFLAVGKYVYNYLENASLNILAVSAFVILLFDPRLLYDIGFLLSYTAVLGILLFGPYFTSLYTSNNKFMNKVWELCAISIAAQLSTLPITLLYFHQFPIWFVLTNLLVIPLCTLLMFLGVLYLLKLTIVSGIINKITGLVIYTIHITDVPGLGYLCNIDFSTMDMLFLMLIIILGALCIKQRSYYFATAFLAIVILWQILSVMGVSYKKNEMCLAVYQSNKGAAFDMKNKTQLRFASTLEQHDYDFHVRNHHITYNYSNELSFSYNYIKSGNFSFLQVKKAKDLTLLNYLKPSVVLFSQDVELSSEFIWTYKPMKVIADGSNKFFVIKNIKAICDKYEIPFHSTKENGFIKLHL